MLKLSGIGYIRKDNEMWIVLYYFFIFVLFYFFYVFFFKGFEFDMLINVEME